MFWEKGLLPGTQKAPRRFENNTKKARRMLEKGFKLILKWSWDQPSHVLGKGAVAQNTKSLKKDSK